MNRHHILLTICLLLVLAFPLFADKTEWSQCAAPAVTEVTAHERAVTVTVEGVTGDAGSDKILVELFENGKLINSKNLGKSKKSTRTIDFDLNHSGSYQVRVTGIRNQESVQHVGEFFEFSYTLPLDAPQPSARNLGDGQVLISWNWVDEAQSFTVELQAWKSKELVRSETVTGTSLLLKGLENETAYAITVSANRGDERVSSSTLKKTVHTDKDRIWNFTWYGSSTSAAKNRFEMLDSDEMVFRLIAGTHNTEGKGVEQGGKFTSYFDGISYYYTKIDAANENFELEATFTVDWINPVPDGQEGFGIVICDTIGPDARNDVNNYTNSVSLLATKAEEVISGTKVTLKDAPVVRFTTGLTEEALAKGDSGVAEYGNVVYHIAQKETVKQGDTYTFKVKKDNTGYHCYYGLDNDGNPNEFILYGPEELLKLDSDYVYVGFAAARWCEVTVSDVKFTVTDPKTDPPAVSKPVEIIPLQMTVDSPSAYYSTQYPFVFISNSDGKLTVRLQKGNQVLIDNADIKANVDFEKLIDLGKAGAQQLVIEFTPDENYKPAEDQVIGSYDSLTGLMVQNYSTRVINKLVSIRTIAGDTIYASPKGEWLGKGTEASPLDLDTALTYVRPGQTLVLEPGTYRISSQILIQRGHDGTAEQPITITVKDGGRAVFDFGRSSSSGIVLKGNYWVFRNLDITRTGDNVKGLQVAGDYNVIENVHAYANGDTGIQISGFSSESFDKWPHDNLILGCVSHDNRDSAENNADGFAAKLTCGEGNVFDSCVAYCNIDDGWDLYAKIETGPIGAVVIRNCVAYRNGSLSDGSGNGDGNGFKLGGDGIAVKHIIQNCISFENGTAGITSNSNPALIVRNCTSYNNVGCNLTLYGKGDGERMFVLDSVLSMEGGESDNIKEMPTLASPTNYLSSGSASINSEGEKLYKDVFQSVDTKNIEITYEDGKLNLNGLFATELGVGAKF